jgi:hypothetical protein
MYGVVVFTSSAARRNEHGAVFVHGSLLPPAGDVYRIAA